VPQRTVEEDSAQHDLHVGCQEVGVVQMQPHQDQQMGAVPCTAGQRRATRAVERVIARAGLSGCSSP
jgi:hypothetical protein